MYFDFSNYMKARASQAKSSSFCSKNFESLNFTLYKIVQFWVVDFCLRGSTDSYFYKIKNPFDYIEKGDDQLHAETLIAQFWSILIKIELSKLSKEGFLKSARRNFDSPTLSTCWDSTIWVRNLFTVQKRWQIISGFCRNLNF